MSFDFLARTGAHKKVSEVAWMNTMQLLMLAIETDTHPDTEVIVKNMGDNIGALIDNAGYVLDAETALSIANVIKFLADVYAPNDGRFFQTAETLERLVGHVPSHYRVLHDELVEMGEDWTPERSNLDPRYIDQHKEEYARVIDRMTASFLYEIAEFFEESNGLVIA